MTYQITWIETATNAAAMLGLDETIRDSDWTIEEAREAALYRGECLGIDIARYEPIVIAIAI